MCTVLLVGMAVLLPIGVAGCGGLTAQRQNSQGVALFEQARYQEAREQFEKAVSDDPKNADAYYNLAGVHHRLGALTQDPTHFEQAERYYEWCLSHDPNHADCYRALAVLLVEQERSEEAFRFLEGWVDRNPSLAEPKIELARLYEEFGDVQAAKENLLEALAVDYQNSRALAALGQLRERAGEHALALADYRQSLWHDRFQPELAARIAAIQTAVGPARAAPAVHAPDENTRYANRNPLIK